MSVATDDMKMVRELVAETAPDPKPAARKPTAPGPMLDEFGGLAEPPSMRLASIGAAPVKRPALEGLPDAEQDGDVISCRENHARLEDALRTVVAERAEKEAELGVAAGASPRVLESMAVALLLGGGSDDAVERLKTLAAREARLAAACGLAKTRVVELLAGARRKLTGEALARVHWPAARAVAMKVVELLVAMDALRLANDTLERAGHARPAGLFSDLDTQTQGQNVTVDYLKFLGLLSNSEVAEALPNLA